MLGVRRLSLLGVVGLLLLIPVGAGAAPNHARFSAVLAREAQSIVAAGAPGVVLWRRDGDGHGDGDVIETATAGLADVERQVRMRPEHRLRVGSVTKTFTAIVVLQLVGEGRLRLSDTVGARLPGVLPAADRVTVRDLLQHTSGIANYLLDPRLTLALFNGGHLDNRPPQSLVAYAATAEPPHTPGPATPYSYSNTNYILLGLIVEAVTGRTLAGELRRRIIRPLRLTATELPNAPDTPGMAHGYTGRLASGRTDVTRVHPSVFWAAGGIVTTAADVGAVYHALFTGNLLAPAQLRLMLSIPDKAGGEEPGLGVFRVRTPCGEAWEHPGYVLGYESFAVSTADGRRQAVVLVNTEGTASAAARAVVSRMIC